MGRGRGPLVMVYYICNYIIIYHVNLKIPTSMLYIWVLAIVMVIAFWGPYRFPGFCGNQHVRDPTWSQNPFLNRLGNGSSSCFVGFRMFQVLRQHFMILSCCIHSHALSFIFLSFASSFHCAFISLHFPFMFLSLVFISIPFGFIFLPFSFQCAFMSSHLPFICTHVPFILHSCPFISFLKWKWLYGLARNLRKPSATNGYREVIAKVIAK